MPQRKQQLRLLGTTLVILVLASLLWPSPTRTVKREPSKRYLVGARYYTRYPEGFQAPHLRSALSPPQAPKLGHYSSWDVEVAEQHIAWAAEYGVDFFCLDYWPLRPPNDVRLELFLQAANIEDIQFCLFYQTAALGSREGTGRTDFDQKTTQQFLLDLAKIGEDFFTQPQYLKVEGRPVLVLSTTRGMTGDYASAIQQARTMFQEQGHDVFLIGDEVHPTVLDSDGTPVSEPQRERILQLDAITNASIYDATLAGQAGYGAASTLLDDLRELNKHYRAATDVPVLPSVMPGFNNRLVSSEHYIVPRQWKFGAEGTSFFYELLHRYALPSSDPRLPVIFINSWNDWNLDTAVEPTAAGTSTTQDRSGQQRFTGGFRYQAYEESCLETLRNGVCAVSGIVRLGQEPVPGALVSAWRGQQLVAVDRSDSRGRYHLSRFNLTPGDYRVGTTQEDSVKIEVTARATARLDLGVTQLPSRIRATKKLDLKPKFKHLQEDLASYLEAFPGPGDKPEEFEGLRYFPSGEEVQRSLPSLTPLNPEMPKSGTVVCLGSSPLETLQVARQLPQQQVYSFWPNRDLYRRAVHSTRLSALANLTALPFAPGERAGLIEGRQFERRRLDSFHFANVSLVVLRATERDFAILDSAVELREGERPLLLIRSELPLESVYLEQLWELGYRPQKLGDHHYLARPLMGEHRFFLKLGLAGSQTHLESGFSNPEKDEFRSFTWSSRDESRLSFTLPEVRNGTYSLGLRVRVLENLAPLPVTIAINGVPLAPVALGPDWQRREVSIASKLLQEGENQLSFHYSRTGQKNGDSRDLAVCFEQVWLMPQLSVD